MITTLFACPGTICQMLKAETHQLELIIVLLIGLICKARMQFLCVDDYEKEAFVKLSKEALDYYRSGADEEITLKANRKCFKNWLILPRFLRDVSNINLNTEVFGDMFGCPIGVSPTAMHKLAHPDGELATAKAVESIKSVMVLSTLSTTSIEDVALHHPNLVKWFQLYLFRDRSASLRLVKRAEEAGFRALVLTVDAPRFGRRRRDMLNGFKVPPGFLKNFELETSESLQELTCLDDSLQWSDVDWLRENTTLPILVKGILTPEDSLLALEHGVNGIVVSNHGGRQLDGVPATIDVLGPIVRAVAGRCQVLVDGGVRTGSDAFKCLALGASMVFVGRPVLWGLACDGADGVAGVLKILRDELELTMSLAGCDSLESVSKEMVVHKSKLVR